MNVPSSMAHEVVGVLTCKLHGIYRWSQVRIHRAYTERNRETIFFYAFSTVHHSIVLLLQPTLMHNSITTCMSHYYPRHVSGLDVPILRRNNCTNTASGILALLSGFTLHRLRACRCTACTDRPPRTVYKVTVPHAACVQCVLLKMSI